MSKLGSLSALKIDGFKSIKNLDLELGNINILIGSNGVGKSNFINFFKFMKKILDKDLQFYISESGGANKFLYFGKKQTKELSFALYFPPNGYACTLVPDINDSLIFKEELSYFKASDIGYHGGSKKSVLASAGDKESKLPNRGNSMTISGHIVKYIQDWKVYHFHDTSSTADVKQTCKVDDSVTLAPNASNLAAFLLNIRNNHEKSYRDIKKAVQRIVPYFHDFILEPENNNTDYIKLKWKHKGSDESFDASDLSDGTLRFICLSTLLLQPNLPTIILLDEPELGLHPYALQLLASIFKKVSKKTQIIASTQSVTFTDHFAIENIIVADKVENSTTFKRLDRTELEQWLNDYTVGDIWQKNIIGGVPTYD